MNKEKEIQKLLKQDTEDTAPTMDEYLTDLLLNNTVGDICQMWSRSSNVKAYACCNMIINALMEPDIGLINQIIKRVDGTVPNVDVRDQYANIVGTALDEVLKMPLDDKVKIYDEDTAIIGIAKAIIYIANDQPGKNVSRKKDRTMAADILLSRTGGMRSEPVRHQLETKYVRPSWSLGDGS